MIHKKDVIVNNKIVANITHLSFKGDIALGCTKGLNGDVLLWFKNIEEGEIGRKLEGMSGNLIEIAPEVIMQFHNPKSVDVLISMLKEVKELLLDIKLDQFP